MNRVLLKIVGIGSIRSIGSQFMKAICRQVGYHCGEIIRALRIKYCFERTADALAHRY